MNIFLPLYNHNIVKLLPSGLYLETTVGSDANAQNFSSPNYLYTTCPVDLKPDSSCCISNHKYSICKYLSKAAVVR